MSIQYTTLKVPKDITEKIKIYCKKQGQPIGEFIAQAWLFIEQDEFDIYDKNNTAALHVPMKQEGEKINSLVPLTMISEHMERNRPDLLAVVEIAKELGMSQVDNTTLSSKVEQLTAEIEQQQKDIAKMRNKIYTAREELIRCKKVMYKHDDKIINELKTI